MGNAQVTETARNDALVRDIGSCDTSPDGALELVVARV